MERPTFKQRLFALCQSQQMIEGTDCKEIIKVLEKVTKVYKEVSKK